VEKQFLENKAVQNLKGEKSTQACAGLFGGVGGSHEGDPNIDSWVRGKKHEANMDFASIGVSLSMKTVMRTETSMCKT